MAAYWYDMRLLPLQPQAELAQTHGTEILLVLVVADAAVHERAVRVVFDRVLLLLAGSGSLELLSLLVVAGMRGGGRSGRHLRTRRSVRRLKLKGIRAEPSRPNGAATELCR